MDRELLTEGHAALIVANKCDQRPSWDVDSEQFGDSMVYDVSAEAGQGLDELVRAIVSRLIPDAPTAGEAVPFRREHVRSLEEAGLPPGPPRWI